MKAVLLAHLHNGSFSSYTWFVACRGRLESGTIIVCVHRVIVDSVLRYEGECDQNYNKKRERDASLMDRVYPKILKI